MDSVCLCVLVLSLLFECGHFGYLGRIDSPDDLLRKNNQGETVSFRVDLPVTSPPRPKVAAIAAPGVKLTPNQVTSHQRHQLSNSNGVGGGLPANKRFRRQAQTKLQLPPEFEQILQRYGSGNSDKIGDVGGNLNFESIQDEFKDFDILLEQFHDSRLTTNRLSSPIADINSSKSPVTQPSTPAILETGLSGQEHRPITTDECGVVGGIERPVPLIQNGLMFERGQLPWLVAVYRTVQNNLLFICGGTLLTDRHVVSAAHCMSRPNVLTPITEILLKIGVHGLNDWSDETVTRKLMAVAIHKDYNTTTLKNDILIFTLNKRVKFTQYIRPACLWSGDTELSRVVGAIGVVAGWGDRGGGDIDKQDEPKMVRVPIVSTKECRASNSIFHKLTYDNTLCAGDRNGAGPCNGDSGSGLYLLDGGKWRLRGIVSLSARGEYGASVCNLNEYIVYTDTAQFLSWIRNILSEKYFD